MNICETERLRLRFFCEADSDFIIQLLNQDSFISSIGDKGVRTKEDAINYLRSGPMASYQKLGFGLSMVELKETAQPIGMCGVLKREQLDSPDLGYALLEDYFAKGYALESASAILDNVHRVHGIKKVFAVTRSNNYSSLGLLYKLGFQYREMVKLYKNEPENKLLEYINID